VYLGIYDFEGDPDELLAGYDRMHAALGPGGAPIS
jgi:hypothetical protein